jgi:hypothetical protein
MPDTFLLLIVTTVVLVVLKTTCREWVLSPLSPCLKVNRHFCEPTSHNFAMPSDEQQVMAKFVSGENWTSVIASSCLPNTARSLPSWFHTSATLPLATSILCGSVRMTVSMAPFVMPAS